MKRARKWGFAAIALSLLLVAACGAKEDNTLNNPVAQTDAAEKTLRVVATTVTYPDFLYSLGVIPVAAENANAEFPSYLNGAFDAVPKLGGVLNLEGILAAEPDLIIGANWRDAKNVDQLAKIAETVLLPDRDNWRDELRDMGDALGKKEQAEQVIADYEEQIKIANESLKPLVGSETFMYMRIIGKDSYVMGPLASRGKVIHGELGLNSVAAFPKDEESIAISLEMLPEFNPDHIILQVEAGDDAASAQKIYEDMKTNAVWKGLKAVKENHVYLVGDKDWMNFSFSPVATLNAVNEIVETIKQHNGTE
ncbi:iron complex transport system substrate-binding protein [Paenibacillus algorifonticola]|uniref:Iron complex transport system substrate-binding protein n=1 Tax=Paenibacillus algorifonticola TaxID=684063 RepID=A0A1I2HQG4_9BACL|nr:ABC transporter substrate-binding protein [Paenibacillus algorifonticola]SFF31922.1 iron complex transport system substrate-binding protein [Paenibacillus algorifonticola]